MRCRSRIRPGLAQAAVVSGESGAAGLAGLLELIDDPNADAIRNRLGVDESAGVLIISTEGATDLASYERIVGRPAHDIQTGAMQ